MKKLIRAYVYLILVTNFLFFQIIVRWLSPVKMPERDIVYILTWIALPIFMILSKIEYERA